MMTDIDVPARQADYPIEKIFTDRWSPRAFDEREMPEADLLTILEAARWAPSAYNVQPWRFAYSLRNDQSWPLFLSLINEFNRGWAHTASAMVILASDTRADVDGKEVPFPSHAFDSGAAWANLALQATHMGYHAHAMAGILHQNIRTELHLPERYETQIAIAIGRKASAASLPESLQEQEKPSPRRPLAQTAFKGGFGS